ncbi:MAG: hypothetical protein K2M06_00570 [Muribaculaceae bacterium]|nr:hypothetical protein [Muribaculaceae bacterium]
MDEDTLERLRASWKNTTIVGTQLNEAAARVEREAAGRRSMGIAHKMAKDYMRLLWIAGLVVCLSVPLRLVGAPLWICVVYGVFGLVMGCIYYSFARYIRKIDFMSLPVVEALEQAVRIRMLQRRILVAGIVLGLVVVIPLLMFFYELDLNGSGRSTFWGGVAGGVIGGIIGFCKQLHFFRSSRKLLKTIEEARNLKA